MRSETFKKHFAPLVLFGLILNVYAMTIPAQKQRRTAGPAAGQAAAEDIFPAGFSEEEILRRLERSGLLMTDLGSLPTGIQ